MSMCFPDDLPFGTEEAANKFAVTLAYLVDGVDKLSQGKPAGIPPAFIANANRMYEYDVNDKPENQEFVRDWKIALATRDFLRRTFEAQLGKQITEAELDKRIINMHQSLIPVMHDDFRHVKSHRKEYDDLHATLQGMLTYADSVADNVEYRRSMADDEDC